MAELSTPQRRRVTREELYAMVWQKPLSRLAEELGISGNRLAKICDKLNVPYPPRGYWAKKEAGKPVVTFKLPARKDGTSQEVDIHPTPPKPSPLPEAVTSAATAAGKVQEIVVPDGTDNLHPRVKAWIAEHKKLQKEREQEARLHRNDAWWASRVPQDLTDRDLYRFRVTSAIFNGIEKAGGKIEKSPITGRVTFQIAGHQVECSIVEKLIKSLRQWEETRKWTAFPDHHQSGLDSSGFLRVSVTTYLGGRKPGWIETQKKKIGDILPEIIGDILATGPILEQLKRDQEERQRRYREEEDRRYEAQRLREIEEKRWTTFCQFAADWNECGGLLAFIAEIEKRKSDGEQIVGSEPLDDWIGWATERAKALDPLRQGVPGLFDAISKISEWS